MTIVELEEMEAKEAFLTALAKFGFITSTCETGRFDEAVIRLWMQQDKTFAADIASIQGRLSRQMMCCLIRKQLAAGVPLWELGFLECDAS